MRFLVGGVGVAVMGFGAWLLFGGGEVRNPWDVVVWLVGAVVLHDALIAPVVFAVGALIAARPGRRILRATLITVGALTLVALPALLRPGTPKNPSVLPLDYFANWLLASGAVVVLAAAGLLLPRAVRTVHERWQRWSAARKEDGGTDDGTTAGEPAP
ncbi:hypothetical protein [Streptomyces sp. NPDC059176]|uniref:hypothetical protein n=1 Tax=Streptomyces sp. NPDC059176 TaxID=3346758 RepID=UPI0036745E35